MSQSRLLLLGFDAMDVELVRRWATAGYLPTFRRLFESAAWTDFAHPPEHLAGTPWPSLNTGLGPLRHDFYSVSRFCKESYQMRPGTAAEIKGDPFWKWFAQSGDRIILADVPFSIPKPEYGGRQFFGWGQHDWPWKRESVPRKLLAGLSAQFGVHPVPYCHNYSTETDSLRRLRSGLLTAIERRTAILKSLITSHDWDLFYAVYSEPHCAGHLMWHLEDETHPRHSAEQLATVGPALREIYAAIDRALGELIGCAGTSTTCVVFFSEGMGPNYHGTHLFSTFVDRFNHRWEGRHVEVPQRGRDGGWLDSLWQRSVGRIPGGVRAGVKHRLPMSLRRWITMKRQQNPNWPHMPAFSLPFDGFSALRINLVGREPRGRIRPGEEYRRYLDAFTAELSQLRNAQSGEFVLEQAFRTDQEIDPLTLGSGPDLIVWWSKSAPVRTIQSPNVGTIAGEPKDLRTGEHVMRGMLLVLHPRARRGRQTIPGMTAADLPATVCGLAGIQPGNGLDGTSRCRDLLIQ